MQSILLQPWTTVQGASTLTSVTQDGAGWVDVSSFADAVFQIDVAEVTGSSSGVVQLALQSSPTRDEAYFGPVLLPVTLAATTTPIVVKTLRIPNPGVGGMGGGPAPTFPMARYLRWQLTADSSTTWGATFRIRAQLSKQSFFTPTQLSGCVLWLRADLGISLSGGAVTDWVDQSGAGNIFAQAGRGSQPVYSSSGGSNGTPYLQFNGTSDGMSTSAPVTAITQNWTQFAFLQNNNFTTPNQYIFATGLTNGWGFDNAAGSRGVLNLGTGAQTFGSATSNWELWINWDTSGVNTTCHVNGVAVTSTGNIAPAAGTGGSTLGALNAGASNWWYGNLGELIIYNRTLSANEIGHVEAYVRARTGAW
jgi:hypothetical protein